MTDITFDRIIAVLQDQGPGVYISRISAESYHRHQGPIGCARQSSRRGGMAGRSSAGPCTNPGGYRLAVSHEDADEPLLAAYEQRAKAYADQRARSRLRCIPYGPAPRPRDNCRLRDRPAGPGR